MTNEGAPLVLSIETATLEGSLALSQGERLIAAFRGEKGASHSEHLIPQIDSMLRAAGNSLADVGLFAAAQGPGSFTGLRIGLATVKALAATLKRPCLGIQTLEAVACSARLSTKILAVLPAGRGELFSQLFSVSAQGVPEPLSEPSHLPPASLLKEVKNLEPLVWAGDGALVYSNLIKEFASSAGIRFAREASSSENFLAGWIIVSSEEPLASSVARLAWRRYLLGETVSAADLKAIYVRPSDAEIKKG